MLNIPMTVEDENNFSKIGFETLLAFHTIIYDFSHPCVLVNSGGYPLLVRDGAKGFDVVNDGMFEGFGGFRPIRMRTSERLFDDAIYQPKAMHISGRELEGFGSLLFVIPTAPENG